jgi:hypothetical protein
LTTHAFGDQYDEDDARTKQSAGVEAFDTLFNKRDYEAAANFWSDSYVSTTAHI